jgi:hypothetical protein
MLRAVAQAQAAILQEVEAKECMAQWPDSLDLREPTSFPSLGRTLSVEEEGVEMTAKQDEEIADLRRQVAFSEPSVALAILPRRTLLKRRDELHQMRERQMSNASNFSREDLAAMAAACPPSAMHDIISKGGAPRPPSADGVSGQLTRAHPSPGLPGSHRGWVEPRPISSPPGVAACDRLVDAQDAKDRHDLMVAEARRAAERKLAEEPKKG